MKFKYFSQLEFTDCGPACVQMILAHFGKIFSLQEVRDKCNITRSGVTFKDISSGSSKLGLDSMVGKVTTAQLPEMPLPCILHWNQEHFVVLYHIQQKESQGAVYHIADPGFGKISLNTIEFERHWKNSDREGVAMFFDKNESFDSIFPVYKRKSQLHRSWSFIQRHLFGQKKKMALLALLLSLSALISWVFPLLLTKLIDEGVNPKKINIVVSVLAFQFALLVGQLLIEWARSMTAARFSAYLSVNIITDFIRKLIRLPVKFFDTRLYTDILQKIDDHSHIEGFLSHMLLQFVFSLVTFIFLSSLLAYYNIVAFGIMLVLSAGAVGWILLFLRKRKRLDYARFRIRSDNRNVLFETILGMSEVKINNAQDVKFDSIRQYQQKMFDLNIKSTNLFQQQQIGVHFLSQLKNIVITFLCAYWVINGQMSFGVMVSIGYIVGQLNAPLDSFVSFFRSAQDANIALNRLDEIQQKQNENDLSKCDPPLELTDGISLNNVSFQYEGSQNQIILNQLSLLIPTRKITAIVGASGSGKTTLLKLILNFYNPQSGNITIDGRDLSRINSDLWRGKCGVVMQDGYIFSGTIGENIALAEKSPDLKRLKKAAATACILNYIESLPLGFNTKIGKSGVELSGGQKQRMLIARAVYRNPDIVIFDEATNALDATNERDIMNNLGIFFRNKTVIIIAHRLSTVKSADQIVVLEKGKIVGLGNHEALTSERGHYFELVKNQLELGN